MSADPTIPVNPDPVDLAEIALALEAILNAGRILDRLNDCGETSALVRRARYAVYDRLEALLPSEAR